MKNINLKIANAIAASLISLTFFSCTHEPEKQAENDVDNDSLIKVTDAQFKNIKLDTAQMVDEEAMLNLTGKVSFDEDKVAKVFPLVSGNVTKVNVTLGDFVKRGQVLATLRSADISDYQNQYEVAKSNLQVAKKNLDIAEELYKTNVNSEKDFLNAQNDMKHAEAEVNKLKEQLSIYGASADKPDALYSVLAPIDGYIVEKNISENMEIRSDNASNIFTVSSLNTVWVLAGVYESDLAKVKAGDEVDVTTLAYPDKVFKGTIQQVGNLINPETKVLDLRIVLDNSNGLLKPEMYAMVKVHLSMPEKIIAVPASSLVFDKNVNYVMVYKKNNLFEKRTVVVLQNMRNVIYLTSGLKEGEVVVSAGSLFVENNNI